MTTEITLRITGMDFNHCAERVETSLQRMDGVIKAEVDPVGTAKLRYDEDRLSQGDLAERVREAGYEVT